ncbi:CTR copper uptake transporter [Abortiporus biennis]|nr:CTR copper uptake transporter [Abortiporus biennis]
MLSLAILALVSTTLAHDNGMDMSMDGAMSLAEGDMLPYLHFTTGDSLWFLGWVPKSAGAMVGTCIGLFLLALVERWISACRAIMEVHWSNRAQVVQSDRINLKGLPTSDPKRSSLKRTFTEVKNVATMRDAPPFILKHDFVRGFIHATQALLQFAFMLAVMTFQVGFILSIVVGMGVGETLFGRFASHAAHIA